MTTLNELLKASEDQRNFNWDEQFFKQFCEAEVRLLSPDPQQGPDGWPYLICETLNTKESESQIESIESVQKLFFWLATRGIGLVVNPRRNPYPDYVFSYGMIWNFRETGFFIRPDLAQKNMQTNEVDYQSKKLHAGPPTEQFLPLYVRKVLKDFFRDQMVMKPRMLMISTDGQNYDLCFSLESLGNPPDAEHAGIAEAIAWFLPTHYSIVLVSQQGLPEFVDL